MPLDLANPLVIFVLAILASLAVYFSGRRANSNGDAEKIKPYACGEDMPPEQVPVSIHMFDFAAFFLVFDVIAIVLIFSYGSASVLQPLLYIALSGLALYALINYRGH